MNSITRAEENCEENSCITSHAMVLPRENLAKYHQVDRIYCFFSVMLPCNFLFPSPVHIDYGPSFRQR